MQLLQVQKQEMKLWQQLEQAIESKIWYRIRGQISNGLGGYCINGALMTIFEPGIGRLEEGVGPISDFAHRHPDKFDFYPMNCYGEEDTIQNIIKAHYKKTGKIDTFGLMIMNDQSINNNNYQEFIDLFKEMDV